MNRALFPDKEKVGGPTGGHFYTRFNMDGLMRGAYKERMEGYAIGRQNGWLSTNDIRELENMNPVPEDEGGDALLVNGNMLPVKAILAKAELTNVLTDELLQATESGTPDENADQDESVGPEQDATETPAPKKMSKKAGEADAL